jgi:hypothetical protein
VRLYLAKMRSRRIAVTLLAALVVLGLASPALAQRGGAVAFVPPARPGPVALRAGSGAGGANFVHARRFGTTGRGRRFLGGYGFPPYFYTDSETETIEPPPAQIIVLPAAPAAVSAQPAKPSESLLLERHGDTWVRISASGDSHPVAGDRPADPAAYAAANLVTTASRRADAAMLSAEIPSAILVFRDGHTEQIRKYVIVASILYTSSDYWSTGSWTRKVPIAELNVPETLKLNQQRGAKFSLPSSPAEVMMRP